MESTIDPTPDHEQKPSSGLTLIDALLQQQGLSQRVSDSLLAIREAITDDPDGDRPFLTVLLRTQGRRLEPIKDALLCLAAQTDQDFEVVIIDHDSTPEGATGVRLVVDSQPPSFRDRIRIVEVTGGTRSRPLNAGIAVANGRFISVFDDDDLLFADWVERFHEASVHGGTRLLRAQTATQRARPEAWAGDIPGYRSLSWPRAEYAKTFDQIDHLRVNHSPFMSWAFPRGLFTELGLTFDEALDVCEDWDMILRASLLVGVEDVPALTSIYRRWDGAASSYTVHSSEIWQKSEKRVIDRLDDSVIVLPQGSVSHIRELLATYERRGELAQLALIMGSRSYKAGLPLRVAKNRWIRVRGTFLHHRNRIIAAIRQR
jgi:glycosyltransferase involved in cell wall biosynthesis